MSESVLRPVGKSEKTQAPFSAAMNAGALLSFAGRPLPFGVMIGLFVASGATGLVAQLCFSKYLGYVVGGTAHAVSAVLAAFMTGLALGAHLGGKLSGRIRRPLVAYGVLELVVALAVALTPLGFRALTPAYVALAGFAPDSIAALSALRWLVALLLVVVPTTAMGATLPLLSRGIEALHRSDASARERRLTALYAANTIGGASGALLAAYLLLPLLGVSGTLFAAAALSAAVGWVSITLGRGFEAKDPEKYAMPEVAVADREVVVVDREVVVADRDVPSSRNVVLFTAFAFGSGALVFASEVLFTHVLALIIGNSAYAFGLILAAFLLSLFVGASVSRPLYERLGERALPFGLCATGVLLLVSLPLWDKLPQLFEAIGETITSFAGREAVRGLAALGILFVPTTLMGLTFPLLLQRVASYRGVGRWVGRLTAINTLGAVCGSLMMGYLVLPALGSESSLLAVGLCFSAGTLFALPPRDVGARRVAALGLGLAVAVAAFTPRWDLAELTSGSNVYFEGPESAATLLSIREDVHGGVTTVTEANGVLTLYTNGKFQGNNGWEMNAQRFFAHYPSIFVQRFDHALVIGLGTGTTLGALAAYPWRALSVVEISPSIVEAARRYFREPNRGALDDPRVQVTLADGRNFLLVNKQRYDLISMELSSIWFAGAANLYSDEFYRIARSRLSEDGIFQQWVQLHHVSRRDFATIVNTLRKNFEEVALFYGGGQGILVASARPLRAERARLAALEQRPEIRATEPFGRALSELTNDVLIMGAGLDAFLEESAREAGEPVKALLSTDDNLYLEYATPRGNVLPWAAREELVRDLLRFRDETAISRLLTP